ncbi:MAG: histidine phosphatase family protein [Ruminococcaceae bacterium]|nr:histidine phosphatase family protein [Oscillospiraceae bacterium]
MRIVFVRHAHPDYKLDCLTDIGHKQAEACAERLADEGIEKIYASSQGRARETAAPTANRLGLAVETRDFIRELECHAKDGSALLGEGHPWYVADAHVAMGEDITRADWRRLDPYCRSIVVERVDLVERGTDEWLAELGYVREGQYYRVVGDDTDRTVAMFSHSCSSTAALAHMLNIAFPLLSGILRPDFTSITVLTLSGEKGALITPHVEILNDARHIQGIGAEEGIDS